MPPYRSRSKNHAGSARRVQSVRTEADGLQRSADCARLDELASADGGAILKSLAVADGIDAARLALHAARLRQLIERGEAGFVAEIILAVAHRG